MLYPVELRTLNEGKTLNVQRPISREARCAGVTEKRRREGAAAVLNRRSLLVSR
jgi:hypothetical protein